jgi:upstream activation factor subunit UAF30
VQARDRMAKRTTKARKSGPTGRRGEGGGRAAKRKQVGINAPVQPDEALAEIVGDRAQPRTEITKRVWDYIKSHRLQDPDDKRTIRPDATLKRVLGNKSRVSMFDIPRALNEHLIAA